MQSGITTFSLLLKRYRGRVRLTQEMLAERAGLSVQAISTLERGVHVRPRVETVYALTGALRLTPHEALLLECAAFQPHRYPAAMTVLGDAAAVDGVVVARAGPGAPVTMPASVQALALAVRAAPGSAD